MASKTDDQMTALIAVGQVSGSLADRQYNYLIAQTAQPRTKSKADLIKIRNAAHRVNDALIVVP